MTATFVPTKLKKSQVINAGPQMKLDADTLKCLLVVAGSGIPSTINSGVQFVADVTGGNAEVTGTGYTRQTLASVTVANDGSVNTQVDFSFANITFSQNAGGFNNARYGVIYDNSIGTTDADHPVLAILDLGATQSAQTGDLVLQAPSGGLIYWA